MKYAYNSGNIRFFLKLFFITSILALITFSSCGPRSKKSSNIDNQTRVKKNIALYESWVEEVLNQGNPDAAENFLALEFIDHSLPPDVPGTVEGFKEWFRMFNQAFPDAKWKIEYISGSDDIVFHHKTMTGTHLGEYMGLEPTGKKITTQETGIMRFKNDEIVEFWGTYDEFSIINKLGLIQIPE